MFWVKQLNNSREDTMMKNMIISLRANLLNTIVLVAFSLMAVSASAQLHTSSSSTYRSYGGSGSQAGTPAASFGHTPGTVSFGTAAAPVASFRSTSTGVSATAPAVGFRKIAAMPAIDADGYAVGGTQGTSGPRRAGFIPNPSDEDEDADPTNPVGDALLPLLLLAAAYMLYITLLRRRKTVE